MTAVKRTVGDIAPEVLPYDNVPSCPIPSIKLLLDLSSNILLDIVLFESGGGDIDGFLLHLLGHVYVLDRGFGATGRADTRGIRGGRCGSFRFFGHADLLEVVERRV